MVLFFRYSRRTLALLAAVLAVEYAIVHRISLDALTRSDAGLSQWRQLVSDCTCTDCEVRHLTLIHDGLYQRAYSVHLMHRVLTISSEDGDPYEAFGESVDDAADGEEDFDGPPENDDDDPSEESLVPTTADGLGAAYAYAPGDMLSTSVPVPATLSTHTAAPASISAHPSSPSPSTTPAAVPALPASPLAAQPHVHQRATNTAPPSASAAGTSASAAPAAAASSDTPRLLQAVVWQHGKVLSLFPWQLRAHFFLSLASTRMYLLMGLWPRTAAVVAAAPRRLRQQFYHHHNHQHHQHQQQQHNSPQGQHPQTQQQQQQQHSSAQPTSGGSDSSASSGGGGGATHHPHPHAQAQAAAHAYAQHAHAHAHGVYDSSGGAVGGSLYGIGRASSDESQSLAAALSALGRGLPVFLPPEMLVEHGVQEDLMASCVFRPAVRHPTGPAPPAGGSGGGSGELGVRPLRRWRTWPSLLGRWVAQLAGKIAQQGGRAAAKLRGQDTAAASPAAAAVIEQAAITAVAAVKAPVDPAAAAAAAAAALPGRSSSAGWMVPATAAPSSSRPQQPQQAPQPQQQLQQQAPQPQPQQAPQHAYVECRLYRTDRARNVSYTCPAVLTVLPSPPRGAASGLSRLLQHFNPAPAPQQHPHQAYAHAHAPPHHPQQQQHHHQQPPKPGSTPGSSPNETHSNTSNPQQHHHHHHQQGGAAPGRPQHHHPRPRSRMLRRLWLDLRYMAYGVVMPYKWAPLLAGLLSPHLFLLACLPAVQSLGVMGPFTVRLCAYHALCLLLTGADHLLLLRLVSELLVRLRRARGPVGRGWRRWLLWGRWLLVDGLVGSTWGFRLVVLGIVTTKQMELWRHLYGPSFRPHPVLSCCLVLPASWLAACAATSAAWRLVGGQQQPTSAPLLLFQEGFLSGLSSPFYSLVYISFAVLGLGGGGVGGGAGGVLGLAAAGSRLPLWLLDMVLVSPLLAVVALDVLWNMDTAARASPLLLVTVNALRVQQQQLQHRQALPGAAGRRGRGAAGAGRGGLRLGGGAAGGGGGGPGNHTSLWMLLESARWWAQHVRDAAEDQRQQLQRQQQQQQQQGLAAAAAGDGQGQPAAQLDGAAAAGGGPPAQPQQAPGQGWAAPREGAAGAVARAALAARHAGLPVLPPRAIAAMLAALLLPLPDARWPPRQQEHHARALDLLLEAAAAPGGGGGGRPGGPRRRRRGPQVEDDDDLLQDDLPEDDGLFEAEADGAVFEDLDGMDDILVGAGAGGGRGGGPNGGGDGGEDPMVRTASGELRPLSELEAELRAGQAQVAALRSQLAAAGRGVPDLLLLGRWPPPLELPTESHGWHEQVPHGFLCPITHALMTQPAMLVSPDLSEASPTYELSAIRQWLRSNRTDPTTGRYLRSYHFLHNDNLRKAIEDWVQDRLERERRQQQQQQQQQVAALAAQRRQLGQRHLSPKARGGAGGGGGGFGRSPMRLRPTAQVVATPATATRVAIDGNGKDIYHAANGPGYGMAGPGGAAAANGGWAWGGGGAGGEAEGWGGRYEPVPGPNPGQRSVCVGTSVGVMRLQSPERRRGGPGEWGPGERGRSRSRGRLRAAGGGDGDGVWGAGGSGAKKRRRPDRWCRGRRRGSGGWAGHHRRSKEGC